MDNWPWFVYCVLCGKRWMITDPRVLRQPHGPRWWCTDDAACRTRHQANLAAMQRGLDQAWGVLDTLAAIEAEGWRFAP